MAQPTREQIRLALYNLIKNLPGLVTVSDILQHWEDTPAQAQPALFLAQGNSVAAVDLAKIGLGIKWGAEFAVYIYARTDAQGAHATSPASILNPFVDALEAAMAPVFPNDRQTLGGLVHHACISGKVETDEGLLGAQAVAIIPIEVYYAAST